MRRRLDAVLLLDKTPGMSSNAALQSARRLLGAAKAGHGGTLDPLASGLLPLLFGEATKFSGTMLDAGKGYLATVRLGVRTDTADAEGRVLAERPVALDDAEIERALAAFRGDILQVPPMHSALKRDGRPLYELARKGLSVAREARPVRIDRLELRVRDGTNLLLEVACSKGTYVRTLADDLGERLGCGAHLAALRRTSVGRFSVDEATTLERLESMTPAEREGALRPMDCLIEGLDRVVLDEPAARRFRQGQGVQGPAGADGRRRVYGPDGRFLGVGELAADARLLPLRLVAEVAQPADNH